MLFTVLYLGLRPRIATERSDSGENRIDKIVGLMRQSRYSIHDLSRTKAKVAGDYARFNLPFELGIDRGAKLFGSRLLRRKCILILESEPYEYRRVISDLSGVDIKHHRDDAAQLVAAVRNWFVENALGKAAGPTVIWYAFTDFASAFYDVRKKQGFTDAELNVIPVPEYIDSIRRWLRLTQRRMRQR